MIGTVLVLTFFAVVLTASFVSHRRDHRQEQERLLAYHAEVGLAEAEAQARLERDRDHQEALADFDRELGIAPIPEVKRSLSAREHQLMQDNTRWFRDPDANLFISNRPGTRQVLQCDPARNIREQSRASDLGQDRYGNMVMGLLNQVDDHHRRQG